MNRVSSILFLSSVLVVLGSGCVIEDNPSETYEVCAGTSDKCADVNDSCVVIAATTSTGMSGSDYYCSHGCLTDADCETSFNGQPGFCLDNGAGGTCVSRCTDDFDCEIGWDCIQSTIAGTGNITFLCLPTST